jgi:ferritin-like metal-binding protein YciE
MAREQLIAWLDDAYAMEMGLAGILEQHANAPGELPEIAERRRRHAEETRVHARRIRECLEMLGTQPSDLKAGFSTLMGNVEGALTAAFRDELMKNALADYASEHFEIGCYHALLAAAGEADETELVPLLEETLSEEEAMAEWLALRIPMVAQQSLKRATGARR